VTPLWEHLSAFVAASVLLLVLFCRILESNVPRWDGAAVAKVQSSARSSGVSSREGGV